MWKIKRHIWFKAIAIVLIQAFFCLDIFLAAGGNIRGLTTHLSPPLNFDCPDIMIAFTKQPETIQERLATLRKRITLLIISKLQTRQLDFSQGIINLEDAIFTLETALESPEDIISYAGDILCAIQHHLRLLEDDQSLRNHNVINELEEVFSKLEDRFKRYDDLAASITELISAADIQDYIEKSDKSFAECLTALAFGNRIYLEDIAIVSMLYRIYELLKERNAFCLISEKQLEDLKEILDAAVINTAATNVVKEITSVSNNHEQRKISETRGGRWPWMQPVYNWIEDWVDILFNFRWFGRSVGWFVGQGIAPVLIESVLCVGGGVFLAGISLFSMQLNWHLFHIFGAPGNKLRFAFMRDKNIVSIAGFLGFVFVSLYDYFFNIGVLYLIVPWFFIIVAHGVSIYRGYNERPDRIEPTSISLQALDMPRSEEARQILESFASLSNNRDFEGAIGTIENDKIKDLGLLEQDIFRHLRAQILIIAGRFDQAIDLLQQLYYKSDTKFYNIPPLYIGMIQAVLGEAFLKRGLEHNNRNYVLWGLYHLGEAEIKLRGYQGAQKIYALLTIAYLEINRIEEAYGVLTQAHRLGWDDPDVYLEFAKKIYWAKKERGEEFKDEDLQKCIEVTGWVSGLNLSVRQEQELFRYLGYVMIEIYRRNPENMENFNSTKKTWKTALKIGNRYSYLQPEAEDYAGLAETLMIGEKLNRARWIVKIALRRFPGDERLHNLLSEINKQFGQRGNAPSNNTQSAGQTDSNSTVQELGPVVMENVFEVERAI